MIGNQIAVDTESIVARDLAAFGERTYVVSMHYMGRKTKRDYRTLRDGGNFTWYNLDPVKGPTERPSVLICLDGYQREFEKTNDNIFVKQFRQTRIPSGDIGEDIVNEMTGAKSIGPGLTGEDGVARPAVWISSCKNFPAVSVGPQGQTVYGPDWKEWGSPEFLDAYPEFMREIEWMKRREHLHCENEIKAADNWHSGPSRDPRNINERHRLAANWIGAVVEEHPWISTTSFGKQTSCPFCGVATPAAYAICQGCNRVINPKLMAEVEASMSAA